MKNIYVPILLCAAICNAIDATSIATVITAPGTYIFGDIDNTPEDPNDACIIIQADNVIVDFQGHAITQSNGIASFNGIVVDSGHTNITLRNIKIKGLTGKGVLVQDNCSDIALESIEIDSCATTGIELAGSLSNRIKNIEIIDSSIVSCNGAGGIAYGVRLIRVDNARLENLVVLENDASTSASGYGMSIEWSSSVLIDNCRFNQNGGSDLAIGIGVYNSSAIVIQNTKVLNTVARTSITGKAIGIRLDTCTNCIVQNVDTAGNSNLVATAYGFESIGGNGNIFELCSGIANIGGVEAAGFRFGSSESNSAIKNSKSRDNNGGASGEGFGILLDTAQYCDIAYNELMNNTGLTGYGLMDTVTDTTNLIAGNIAFENETANYSVTRITGTFPVITAQVGNFTPIASASKYMNIDFTV